MKKIVSCMLTLCLLFSAVTWGNIECLAQSASEGSSGVEGPATIEETVLVDESNVKITATKLEGNELSLLIENNSDISLMFQAGSCSINGYMVEALMSPTVTPGKKINDKLIFSQTSLDVCGIDAIADIEMSFSVYTAEEWDVYLITDLIQLKTSIADEYEYNYDESGTPLYEGNGIKVVSKEISEDYSFIGPSLMLYIHNTSDQSITVQARDLSINGFMISNFFSAEIGAGKHAVTGLSFIESELEENNISEISDLEFSLLFFTTEDWNVIEETDLISVTL